MPRLKASNVIVFQETATRLEREWKSQKRARQTERFEEEADNKMCKLLSRAKYEHRAATLDHSSSTLVRDFQAFGRYLSPCIVSDANLLASQILTGFCLSLDPLSIAEHPLSSSYTDVPSRLVLIVARGTESLAACTSKICPAKG